MYDPTRSPELIRLKVERVEYWLKAGAKPSPTVARVIERAKKQKPVEKKA
jgi:small subunit ribosomal protein S16